MGERGAHLDPRLPVHWADAHRRATRRRESGWCISGGLRGITRERCGSGLTGNGPACKGDKDEGRFDRWLRRWALLADRQSVQGSSLLRTEGDQGQYGRVSFLSYPSRSDSKESYSPPGCRSLLTSFSIPDLMFAFVGGAVGRVLRFRLPSRRCTMARRRATRRRARNEMRSLGVSMGFILRVENRLGFAHGREALIVYVSQHDAGVCFCCCYGWRGGRIFHQKEKNNCGEVQEHLVPVCCRGGALINYTVVSVCSNRTAVCPTAPSG